MELGAEIPEWGLRSLNVGLVGQGSREKRHDRPARATGLGPGDLSSRPSFATPLTGLVIWASL